VAMMALLNHAVRTTPQSIAIKQLKHTLCPRKNCTPRQCTVELSSPNAS